jgi:hypothetical protein
VESIVEPVNSSLHTIAHLGADEALLETLDCTDEELEVLEETFNELDEVIEDDIEELLATELLTLVLADELAGGGLSFLSFPPPQAIMDNTIAFISINFFINITRYY